MGQKNGFAEESMSVNCDCTIQHHILWQNILVVDKVDLNNGFITQCNVRLPQHKIINKIQNTSRKQHILTFDSSVMSRCTCNTFNLFLS